MVKLAQPGQKAAIFAKIANLKRTPYKTISVSNEYPACIRRLVAAAEKTAYQIRVDSSNQTKTRIEIANAKPIIKIKTKGSAEFVTHKVAV